MSGFISLHRSLQDSSFYGNPEYVALWVHLLLKANYKDKTKLMNGREVTVKRGSFITGINKLVDETGISKNKLERGIKYFISVGMIKKQSTNKYSIISIVKYDEYQTDKKQIRNKQETDKTQICTTNKDNKEISNIKSGNPDNSRAENAKLAIDKLNEICEKRFQHTDRNLKFAKARLAENFSLDDFVRVINFKKTEWAHQPEMYQYLRPETLFGPKFESYLEASKTPFPVQQNLDHQVRPKIKEIS